MNYSIINLIQSIVKTECPEYFLKYKNFFDDEIINEFVENILLYPKIKNKMNELPKFVKPRFSLEIKYDLGKLIFPFFNLLSALNDDITNKDFTANQLKIKKLFCNAKIEELLLILGQRITPGSIRDEKAIPPKKAILLTSAKIPNKAGLFEVARALSKHSSRSNEKFWGKIQGSITTQNEKAIQKLEELFAEKTWWNIFGHGKHDLIYEIRVPAGYGARWRLNDMKFIGFIEPVDPESGISFYKD